MNKNCETCKVEFSTDIQYQKYCSNSCKYKAHKTRGPEFSCTRCGKVFNRRLTEAKRSPNIYCSRSCSAKQNNRQFPKRKPEGKCKTCSVPIKSAWTYCKKCFQNKLTSNCDGKTLDEVMYKNFAIGKRAKISDHARSKFKNQALFCRKCGYSKHVEICHIRAVKDFPPTTLLKEVNSVDNLIPLCRNCHWEFDHQNKIKNIENNPLDNLGYGI